MRRIRDMKVGEYGVIDHEGDLCLVVRMFTPSIDEETGRPTSTSTYRAYPFIVCISSPRKGIIGDWWSIGSVETEFGDKEVMLPKFLEMKDQMQKYEELKKYALKDTFA